MGNRAYVRFANGTVQIETLLGVRNFASFDEAREFIGCVSEPIRCPRPASRESVGYSNCRGGRFDSKLWRP